MTPSRDGARRACSRSKPTWRSSPSVRAAMRCWRSSRWKRSTSSSSTSTCRGQLVTVHTRDRAILSDATLQELEARLAASHFERVHRRAIVNLLHVERLEPVLSGGYVARVAGGKSVDVSRQAARKLRRRLGIA